jgi:hypothetical protein
MGQQALLSVSEGRQHPAWTSSMNAEGCNPEGAAYGLEPGRQVRPHPCSRHCRQRISVSCAAAIPTGPFVVLGEDSLRFASVLGRDNIVATQFTRRGAGPRFANFLRAFSAGSSLAWSADSI